MFAKVLAGAALMSGALLASATGGSPAESLPLNVGMTQTATDVGLYVAQKRGYFREEGLDVNFVVFASAAQMIAPFASGDLDAAAGAPSAGLYNAVARGIDIRMVADKVSPPPGRPSQTLIVRKDLVDSGRFKGLPDLKGLHVANVGLGSAADGTLFKMLEKGGLRMSDVDIVYLGFPQQVLALANKAVDAAVPAEPFTTEAIRKGLAVPIITDDQAYPGHEIAVIFYSGAFAKQKPEAAAGFMRAYLRGVRDFNDALDGNGRLSGDKGEAIVAILTEYTAIKDPDFFRKLKFAACNPDGTLNIDSIRGDLEIWKSEGQIEHEISAERAIDTSFLDAALKELGPYRPSPR